MSNAHLRKPLFVGTITNGVTQYVGVPIKAGKLGCQIAWLDATSKATITLEATSYDEQVASVALADATAAYKWKDTGLTITGPTAAAADSTLVNLENIRQRRARLKIVATANCSFEILPGFDEA